MHVYIVCSVPQGSVLGPRLFILYSTDLAHIAEKHGVTIHSFADDTQLYLHCVHDDTSRITVRLEHCRYQPFDVGQSTEADYQ